MGIKIADGHAGVLCETVSDRENSPITEGTDSDLLCQHSWDSNAKLFLGTNVGYEAVGLPDCLWLGFKLMASFFESPTLGIRTTPYVTDYEEGLLVTDEKVSKMTNLLMLKLTTQFLEGNKFDIGVGGLEWERYSNVDTSDDFLYNTTKQTTKG